MKIINRYVYFYHFRQKKNYITFPGLRIFNGSSAFLIDFIAFIPDVPNSSISNCFLPIPIPCSPVTVPLTRNDSLKIK